MKSSYILISVSLDRIKAQEFEVYIQEVKGAQYVSITLPKCKIKVVDDCPTYGFKTQRLNVSQSDGDIVINLSSQIAAVGKSITWKTEAVMPNSFFKTSGTAVVAQDRACSVIIPMIKTVQPITSEEFKIRIDFDENKGLITDVAADLMCTVVVSYDIRPASVEFQATTHQVHRKEAKVAIVDIVRSTNTNGPVEIIYELKDETMRL